MNATELLEISHLIGDLHDFSNSLVLAEYMAVGMFVNKTQISSKKPLRLGNT